ncbi:elongation factor G [Chelativorans sp. YIM 93263]|uniref:elongation factor G n=1 Tax=Chelativorans sp. YIM 93263 TaxID=2906648 RepID=UPI002379D3E6|nr:elongation factor G [Chelativorans sp. YIM 93263]
MGNRAGERHKGPKCIAILGPLESGKTTLFDAILARTGTRSDRAAHGDAAGYTMSVEAGFASTQFMDENITFVDCPGSVEFSFEAEAVLAACDAAVVVIDADDMKLPMLQLILRRLDALGLPRMVFVNKIDKTSVGVRDLLKELQPISSTPLLLRQIPMRQDGTVVGSIDLALERAYIYREHAPSEIAAIPDDEKARELEARFSMLETLADHDDLLLEQLLDDVEPPRDAVFDDLTADLREGSVTPVLIGTAQKGHGVLRLLKAIRHDVPDVTRVRQRLGLDANGETVVQVMKTVHTGHGGKISVARILAGSISDGAEIPGTGRVSGLYTFNGRDHAKGSSVGEGETAALGKLENVQTGDTLSTGKTAAPTLAKAVPPQPVFAMAVNPRERKDEVRLSSALQKLAEEDPSLILEQNQDTSETILRGQGEMHLRNARERLESRFQITVEANRPLVPYRETIRKQVQQRGRHKKQSGGHGQFGDVVLEIRPLPRGGGFEFTDTITGGVVPKQFIPSVETGVRDALHAGPLGFPVVDIAVNLADGSYHTVDSSDMAFQAAARLAMREGLASADPVLLEPILKVEIDTPSDATARITAILSQRRGQILGFDTRTDWPGWDRVDAMLPQAGIGDLIIELRSATAGAATYRTRFDHMAELTGRLADEVLNRKGKAA